MHYKGKGVLRVRRQSDRLERGDRGAPRRFPSEIHMRQRLVFPPFQSNRETLLTTRQAYPVTACIRGRR